MVFPSLLAFLHGITAKSAARFLRPLDFFVGHFFVYKQLFDLLMWLYVKNSQK